MKKIILSILFIMLVRSSFAQWTADTTVNTIVHDTAGATVPLCASMANGSTYISWFEYAGGNFELRMQLLDANGIKQWSPDGIVVSNYPQNSALYVYDLKLDLEGNAIVAFQDERFGSIQIVAYKVDANGTLLWGAAGVSLLDSTSTQGMNPNICVTTENDILIAWNAEDASSRWIDCQRISSSGTIQWNSLYTIKDTVTNLNFYNPMLTPSDNGNIQMLFDQGTASFYGNMYVQKIDGNGNNIWSTPKQVSTKSIASYYLPKLISDQAGGFYVSFNTSNPVSLSLNDVYVQHVDSGGITWSVTGTEAANSTSNHKSTSSSCLVSSSGEFWVLLQVLDGSQSLSGTSVQKFDNAGNVLLGPDGLVVIPMDAIYFNPSTIDDAGNGIILTVNYGGFGSQRLKAIKLDYSGLPLWTNTSVSVCATNSNKDDVQSGDFINNNLVIVWQDDRNGSGIFAQNITGDGLTGITTGLTEHVFQNDIRIYPNPSEDPVIEFTSGLQMDKYLRVTDMTGKEITAFEIPVGTKSVSLSGCKDLPNGIYFVSVINAAGKQLLKWIR